MSSAEELIARQRRLADAAADLAREQDDPRKLLEKAADLASSVRDLEAAALRFAAAHQQEGGREEVVVLTPDQRARLAEVTGQAMETLVVRDADGSFARAMPTMQKMIVERMAARQASGSAKKKATRAQLEKLLRQLKALGVPELQPVIDAIEEDPTLEKLQQQQEQFAREMKDRFPDGA